MRTDFSLTATPFTEETLKKAFEMAAYPSQEKLDAECESREKFAFSEMVIEDAFRHEEITIEQYGFSMESLYTNGVLLVSSEDKIKLDKAAERVEKIIEGWGKNEN